ncbi:MAG: sporulation transcriptional regulator SpoIIID [Clostridia bacterium]|nr:sporulation transcriptional regulator SpoIIID [Clostridia bacterium]MBQ9847478.1 sporulation transcriptional regulator SpoIIID [Clostridia bacterium]
MISDINERAVAVGEFVAASGATVRAAAKRFGISKSTVHKDLTGRLKKADPMLFKRVAAVLAKNRAERHLRGGNATRLKYKKAEPS